MDATPEPHDSAHLRRLVEDGLYGIVYLDILHPETRQPGYLYMAVKLKELSKAKDAYLAGKFRPTDFGVILESGLGVPDADCRARMEEMYGFDHADMLSLKD